MSSMTGKSPLNPVPLHQKKKMSIDDVLSDLKICFDDLSTMETYDNLNCVIILHKVFEYYTDYPTNRKDIADKMAELKYSEQLIKMIKSFSRSDMFKKDVFRAIDYTMLLLWNYSDVSSNFCEELINDGIVEILGANLEYEPYIENQSNQIVIEILRSSLGILHNLTKRANDMCERAFENAKIKENMRKNVLTSEHEDFKCVATMLLTAMISEEDNKMLDDTGSVSFMVRILKLAINNELRRHDGFSPSELVECLGRMSQNDKNKKKIVAAGALPELVKMMEYDSPDENAAAAHNIWILCFDTNICEQVKSEPGMLEALMNLKHSTDKQTSREAKGVLWTIKQGHQKVKQGHQKVKQGHQTVKQGHQTVKQGQQKVNATTEDKKVFKNEGTYVFISYQWGVQPMIKQLNARLKGAGYRTWLDIEKMKGSTMEAMAEAVERAAVVLICASENYKLSPNCRAEAEYTFQRNKQIVPLMMQRRYKPDGWLGFLLGAKLYINFDGKYEFDEAFEMLLKELGERGKADV